MASSLLSVPAWGLVLSTELTTGSVLHSMEIASIKDGAPTRVPGFQFGLLWSQKKNLLLSLC